MLYGLATDIAEIYNEIFDWLRYKDQPFPGHTSTKHSQKREHGVKWESTKITGLPDDQFVKLLLAAKTRWSQHIAPGDKANSADAEAQRGALFYRNVALLFVLRYAGSRRNEANQLRIDDIDRSRHLIHLVTKGHHGERLPVVLYEPIGQAIWLYVTRFRPFISAQSLAAQSAIFLSHSTRNYGQPLTGESIRALIDSLRNALDPPWNKQLTPHMLRHAFGYDLQKMGGPSLVTANMRHASIQSGAAYAASAEILSDEILKVGNARIRRLFERAGLTKDLLS